MAAMAAPAELEGGVGVPTAGVVGKRGRLQSTYASRTDTLVGMHSNSADACGPEPLQERRNTGRISAQAQ